jgi:glycosyltransferase involved in cell wall biosynthesis
MAKVDVVVPCYNYGRFLTDCVHSVLGQSIADVRVLIIDDASADDSVEVASRLRELDPRVELIAHARNQGHINTYNEGIEWASADYFLLLSADDLLVPGALQRAVEIMEGNPDIVLTHGECIDWHDHLPVPHLEAVRNYTWKRHDLLNEICKTAANVVPTPTAIARTITQKKIGGYKASLPHSGDMEMWLRFSAAGSVARIDAVQAIYRRHSNAMSNPYFAERMTDFRHCQLAFDSFFDDHDSRLENSQRLRTSTHRALAYRVFSSGIRSLRRGRVSEAYQFIRTSMDMDHRLRYLPPVWQVLKLPGREGRQWALSGIQKAFGNMISRTPRS